MKEISVNDIRQIRIGQMEDAENGTGCTVFVCEEGMRAGLDVRGGGPASRESELLKPLAAAQYIHSIVLAGGSAFGLGTANGVMKCLEERNIGFDVGVTKVPLVVQSDLFDLTVGSAFRRPDPEMGYAAAVHALDDPNYRDGNYGAGCGATVGKITGMDNCMKTGKQIAGLLKEDGSGFRDTQEYMKGNIEVVGNRFAGNTTLGVVITNAEFRKPELCKIAGMAHDGFARSIRPVHTSADGDSIYAVSVGNVRADQDVAGALAAEVVSEAITRAVNSAESAYGFPAAKDLSFCGK